MLPEYPIAMEVFVHSHYETGERLTWEWFGIKSGEWLHWMLLDTLSDPDWREENLSAFDDLPLDTPVTVNVKLDGDDYGSGLELWIDSVEIAP